MNKVATKTSGGSSIHERMKTRAAAMNLNSGEREILVPLDKIRFDPKQPRQAFHTLDGRVAEQDQQSLEELAHSIKEQELIEAITVRENGDGTFTVVVGERRTRAHLLLGLPSIRAIVRNDLTNPALRLLYQLAENVNRQDLTDAEMSASILQLLKGDEENGVLALNQLQVAERLGRSEGWVTRYVKFGDAELQRVWFHSGIADTVEKVYRLSTLPKPVQVEIIRRAALSEGDPERLGTPLNRETIDEFAREVKRVKREEQSGQKAGSQSGHGAAPAVRPGQPGPSAPELAGKGGVHMGGRPVVEPGAGASKPGPIGTGGYRLDPSKVAEIRGAGAPAGTSGAGTDNEEDKEAPPVFCRVLASNVSGLLEFLKQKDADVHEDALGVRCEVSIPGELAKRIANQLAGMIVDDQEIAAVLQAEFAKLSV